MLPVQGLLVIPAGLLVVSWAWSGDWLLDRPAPGRWVRLGLLLTGMFALVVSWYAGFRAWSIRDVGPIAPPAVLARSSLSPATSRSKRSRPLPRSRTASWLAPSRIHPSSSTETGEYLTSSVARRHGPTADSWNLKS